MNFRTKNIVYAILLFPFFFVGCNNLEQGGFSILPASLRSTESHVSNNYINYIEKASTANFTLAKSLRKNEAVVDGFSTEIAANPDLLFLPATLWQMYTLKEKENWEQQAGYYTKEVENAVAHSNFINGEIIQSVYLTPYKLKPNKKLLGKIIESLSKYISTYEIKSNKNKTTSEYNLDLLLESKIMFLATKETGDPVFRNFVLENTTFLYEEYFKQDLRLMSVLTNDVSENKLAILRTEDFYKLAVGICGFYELYKETGIEDYLTCCKTIATVFKTILVNTDIDVEIVNRVDLISQSLVSLALLDLSQQIGDSYEEASLKMYENILHKIETAQASEDDIIREEANLHESFRLYHYLLEYELRKQNLI